jgi:catechol 2,3-dioxygenase-like lactoylglutathione lyase family enzyme
VADTGSYPTLLQTVLDTEDPRELAEFYRRLLGYQYRPGDEPPPEGEPDPRGEDWLVLFSDGVRGLAFQKVDSLPRPTWPEDSTPQMLHLDMGVPDAAELGRQHDRAIALGATVLFDRTDDENEPLYVFADPTGHPFCIFVGE